MMQKMCIPGNQNCRAMTVPAVERMIGSSEACFIISASQGAYCAYLKSAFRSSRGDLTQLILPPRALIFASKSS